MKKRNLKKGTVHPKNVVHKKNFGPKIDFSIISSKKVLFLVLVFLAILITVFLLSTPAKQDKLRFSQFSCEGVAPKNAILCENDNLELISDTTITLTAFCTSKTKCQYVCDKGYKKWNNSCIAESASIYSCTGEIPANATLCNEDDLNLKWGAENTIVSDCTSFKKCEYTCKEGFIQNENVCEEIFCKDANSIDLIGEVVAIATESSDFTSGVSPLGGKTKFFLIFDNNNFIDAVSNPYLQVGTSAGKNFSKWLLANQVDTVVFADVDNKLAEEIVGAGISCIKVTGKTSDLTGRQDPADLPSDYHKSYSATQTDINSLLK